MSQSLLPSVPRGTELLSGKDFVNYLNTHQKSFVAIEHGLSETDMKARAMRKEYVTGGNVPFAPEISTINEDSIPAT